MTLRTVTMEPTLREMLADPIVRAVMSRDGVSDQDIASAVGRARRWMSIGRGASLALPTTGLAPTRHALGASRGETN